jgi:hypothetical protein
MIIDEDYFLSDQFTPAIRANFKSKVFYIQRTESGDLLNRQEAGKIQILKNTQAINDTIRISLDNRISIDDGTRSLELAGGTLLRRLFKYQNKFYVENLANGRTGWIVLRNSEWWEKHKITTNTSYIDNQIYNQIDNIVADYNQRLGKLFNFLNDKNKTNHPLPYWSAEQSITGIQYTMEPNVYRNRFHDSQFYLIQELRDLLHGSSFQVKKDHNKIIISTKSN